MANEEENKAQGGRVAIRGQYIKDLSFENPKAPDIFAQLKEVPNIDLALNVNVRNSEDHFEVELDIEAKAKIQEDDVFVVSLKYAGIFQLMDIADEQKDGILLIYCPSLIFPFARRIVADITRDGGFQPLMLDPIDFAALYEQKRKEMQAKEN